MPTPTLTDHSPLAGLLRDGIATLDRAARHAPPERSGQMRQIAGTARGLLAQIEPDARTADPQDARAVQVRRALDTHDHLAALAGSAHPGLVEVDGGQVNTTKIGFALDGHRVELNRLEYEYLYTRIRELGGIGRIDKAAVATATGTTPLALDAAYHRYWSSQRELDEAGAYAEQRAADLARRAAELFRCAVGLTPPDLRRRAQTIAQLTTGLAENATSTAAAKLAAAQNRQALDQAATELTRERTAARTKLRTHQRLWTVARSRRRPQSFTAGRRVVDSIAVERVLAGHRTDLLKQDMEYLFTRIGVLGGMAAIDKPRAACALGIAPDSLDRAYHRYWQRIRDNAEITGADPAAVLPAEKVHTQ